MTEKSFLVGRLYFTGLLTVGIWTLLIWDHFHGGVPSHHLLHQENLPKISNWWGGLLLPVLSWYLTYRIQIRLARNSIDNSKPLYLPKKYLFRFLLALSFGILQSIFFILDYIDLISYLFYGLFLSALFFPIYRAECFLGFVIGMAYGFGIVLPTLVGIVLAVLGALLYLYVRMGIIYLFRMVFFKISNRENIDN